MVSPRLHLHEKRKTWPAIPDDYANFHYRTQFSHLGTKASIHEADKNFEEFIWTPLTVRNVQFLFLKDILANNQNTDRDHLRCSGSWHTAHTSEQSRMLDTWFLEWEYIRTPWLVNIRDTVFEVFFCNKKNLLVGTSGMLLAGGSVRPRKWSRPANDPSTTNDPQIGPQMIPRPEMIPANSRMAWTPWLVHGCIFSLIVL